MSFSVTLSLKLELPDLARLDGQPFQCCVLLHLVSLKINTHTYTHTIVCVPVHMVSASAFRGCRHQGPLELESQLVMSLVTGVGRSVQEQVLKS